MHLARRRRRALYVLMGLSGAVVLLLSGPLWLPQLEQHRDFFRSARARLRGARFMGDQGVILQSRWNECGVAALQMVLAAHGIVRKGDLLRSRLHLTATGTTLFDLRRAAAAEGLEGRSWRLDLPDLKSVPLPAIAFINGDHFVVVDHWLSTDVLEIHDPALGRLRWPATSFSHAWSGEILIFDPNWKPKGGARKTKKFSLLASEILDKHKESLQ